MGEGNLNAAIRFICVAAVASCIAVSGFAQDADSTGGTGAPGHQAAGSVPVAATADENGLIIGEGNGTAAPGTAAQAASWPYFLRMIIVLALVVASIYGVFRLMRSLAKPRTPDDPYLKVLASTQLGPGRWLYIVSVGAKAFLVGSTEGSISPIGELDDKELVDTLQLRAVDAPTNPSGDFSSLIRSIMKPGVIHSEKTQASELARQRERLRKF
ncbi:MAG: flagellar biosynthetic protein FliO [Spirochaetes bacterium]|nr:flagellar biosynthetic protein FliO [Spirochaetota bacterium]